MKSIKKIVALIVIMMFAFSSLYFVKADEENEINETNEANVTNETSIADGLEAVKVADVFKLGAPYGEDETVEYDGILNVSKLFDFPNVLHMNTEQSVTIDDSSIGNYKFYYQAIYNKDKSKFDAINNMSNNNETINKYKSDLEEIELNKDKKYEEYQALITEVQTLNTQYQAMTAEEKTSAEGLALKEQIQAKQATANNKYTEYQEVDTSYTNLFNEYREYVKNLYLSNWPKYDDSKWVELSTKKIKVNDLEEEYYGIVLWGKLEYTKNGQTVVEYSSSFYSNKWNNESSESNVIVVNDINGDFTTADKPIPQTGDASKIIIGSSIVLIVAGYVLFRKYKNTQIK